MPTRYAGSDEERRALDTYIKLLRAASAVESRATRHLADAGLTPSQFGVLEALYHLGPLRPSELADKHLMSRGNITTVCDNLEKQGLVRRERDQEDRRQLRIHLTVRGRTVVREVLPLHVHAVVLEMETLTAAEQETLARLCRKVGRREEI